VFSGR